jgi:hypothetical protein
MGKHDFDEASSQSAPAATVGDGGFVGLVPESRLARPSRRRLLIGAVAAGAGVAASAAAGVGPAAASTGNSKDVQLGEVNSCSATTEIEASSGTGLLGTTVTNGESGTAGVDNSPGGGHGAYGRSENGTGIGGITLGYGQAGVNGVDSSTDGGIGVYGTSTWGTGVKGTSVHATGVIGTSSQVLQSGVVGQGSGGAIGVSGSSDSLYGVFGQTQGDTQSAVHGHDQSSGGGYGMSGYSDNGTGVFGLCSTSGQSGVFGKDTSSGGGHGVYGSSADGVGVLAESSSGTALSVQGTVSFSRSGMATVPAGKATLQVDIDGLTTSSLVLATVQQLEKGVHLAAAVPAPGSFTVHLTAAPTTALNVAWFVIG